MNKGGPAFPRPTSIDTSSGTLSDGDAVVEAQDGMSLRDYFAAVIAPAIYPVQPHDGTFEQMAAYCYAFADAMILVRSKPTEKK